jgi:hypothetical protein
MTMGVVDAGAGMAAVAIACPGTETRLKLATIEANKVQDFMGRDTDIT